MCVLMWNVRTSNMVEKWGKNTKSTATYMTRSVTRISQCLYAPCLWYVDGKVVLLHCSPALRNKNKPAWHGGLTFSSGHDCCLKNEYLKFSGGSRISQRGRQFQGEAPTYYLAKFSQKLDENEEIWIGGGHKPKILLCGSTTEAVEALITLQYVKWYLFVKWGEPHTERYLPRSTWCKYIYKKRFLNQICTGTFTHKSAFYGIRTSF